MRSLDLRWWRSMPMVGTRDRLSLITLIRSFQAPPSILAVQRSASMLLVFPCTLLSTNTVQISLVSSMFKLQRSPLSQRWNLVFCLFVKKHWSVVRRQHTRSVSTFRPIGWPSKGIFSSPQLKYDRFFFSLSSHEASPGSDSSQLRRARLWLHCRRSLAYRLSPDLGLWIPVESCFIGYRQSILAVRRFSETGDQHGEHWRRWSEYIRRKMGGWWIGMVNTDDCIRSSGMFFEDAWAKLPETNLSCLSSRVIIPVISIVNLWFASSTRINQ